ncbi:ABC transporter ATP-binding protein [Butyricimonas paravirosa]|uniref:ABC transporter ATP-binding protein n=1 Tax=Butyricimonas paravirosa TaxID=1472417 RepID=UPI00210AFEAA|nr:ABC transporter ATP-binding protein [Butyricimonas paravirosa]MCQ4874514.1 ABC transporter ATP-binding protein [Butyricimonas paravirosa]
MIVLEDVNKVFYTDEIETHALENINLTIKAGEFASIMGPSGCGKSTMLNIMGLLDTPTSGRVVIDGVRTDLMLDKDMARMRNLKLGFIFQSFHLIPSLNVLDNVLLPMLYRKGSSQSENKKRALDIIEQVGLTHRLKHFPSQLSGGQCQRVAIARALIGEPKVILADEPTGNLDSKMGEEIMEILARLNREGVTIVMVTHDEGIAKETSRIIRLFDGKLV